MKQHEITLLIACNNYINYLGVKTYLSKYHIRTIFADDPQKVIELCIHKNDVDLVLLEMSLKGVSGFKTAHSIKAMRNIPIFVQTEFASEFRKGAILHKYISGYIEKPLKPHILIDTIRQTMAEKTDINLKLYASKSGIFTKVIQALYIFTL
jgi:CheY-like chemotaxis protein